MSNDLTNIMPKILARGLLSLREQAVMPRLVNYDFSTEAGQFGDTVDVPLPSSISASTVTPGTSFPTPSNATPSRIQVTLDNWKKANFFLTDKELMEVDRNATFLPMQMSEAIRALANAVNDSVFAEYKKVYNYIGTAGTTPFGTGVGIETATEARKMLNKSQAPKLNRRGVLDFDAEAEALSLPQFSDAEKIGSSDVKIDGEVGRKFGVDWFADDAVPTHAAGTAADATVTCNDDEAAGSTQIKLNVSSGTATVVAGDILTISGDDQTYVVTEAATLDTSGVQVSISPALKVAINGDPTPVSVDVKESHVVNMAFHRDAFALAMRPLSAITSELSLGHQIMAMTDEQTGISLRLEVSRQYKQTVWEFDVLWGVKLVRPELALRIAG